MSQFAVAVCQSLSHLAQANLDLVAHNVSANIQ